MSWASGLRLYALVFVLGALGRFGGVQLPGWLEVLTHPLLLGVSGVMLLAEFFADKLPWVDSMWDAVHTFIRIPTGAALAAAANLLVCLLLPPAVPWSVLPLGLYTTGMSLAAPSITLFILDLFPELRGTVSSLQGFVQTLFASVVAGVIAPLLWDAPLHMALGMAGFLVLGYGFIVRLRYSLRPHRPAA